MFTEDGELEREKFESPVPSDPTVVGVVWWVAIIPELVRGWKLLSNSWSRVVYNRASERTVLGKER